MEEGYNKDKKIFSMEMFDKIRNLVDEFEKHKWSVV